MKKILTLLLVIALALGTFTGCDMIKGLIGGGDNNEVTGPTLDEAKTYLFNIYKDSAAAPVVDYDLVAKVIIDGTSFAVTWTVNNDAITIKESNKANFWTVDLPSKNDAEVAYVLTATITDAEGATVQLTFNKTLPVIDSTGITTTPVEGTAYKLYMVQVNLGQKLYATATDEQDHKYIQTTNDATKAADFYVEKDGDGYKWYTIIDGVKNYVYAQGVNNNGKISKYIGFSTENATVFNHVAETNSWQTRIDGTPYCVGTYNTYKTICISEATYITAENTGVSQFVVEFMTASYANTLTPDAEPETITDSAKVIEKVYGLADGETVGGTFIITGTITELDSYGNPTIVVAGLEDKPVLCYKLTDDRFVVGATLTVTAKMLKNYKETYELMECTLNNIVLPGNEPAPETQLGVVDLPEVGVAYKLGLFHGNEAADVFFNGNIYVNNKGTEYPWYLAYAGATDAIDVYLEAVEGVEGSYRLYFMNGEAKTYIRMYPRDGDTTKGTLELTTTVPTECYTYNTEYKTLVYTSTTGEQFYMGSSGTYTSISTSAISYISNSDSYPVHFYAAGAGNGGNNGGDTPVDPTPDPAPSIGIVEAPVVDTAYNFGLINPTKDNNVYYISGGMAATYYLATSSDLTAALDVYLETADGGYYLYVMDNGSKLYINITVNDTHVNSVYENTPATVFTYDATLKTVVVNVNDATYAIGTRNDKNYTTVGPVDVSKDPFICHFYGAVEGGTTTPDPTPDPDPTPNPDPQPPVAGNGVLTSDKVFADVPVEAEGSYPSYSNYNGSYNYNGLAITTVDVLRASYGVPYVFQMKKTTGAFTVSNVTVNSVTIVLVTTYDTFSTPVVTLGGVELTYDSAAVLATKEETGTNNSSGYAVSRYTITIALTAETAGDLVIKNTSGYAMYLESIAIASSGASVDPAPSCEHTNTTTNTVDATCTAAGSTTVVCNDCGKTVSTTAIDALGHSYVDGVCSKCNENEPAGPVEVTIPEALELPDDTEIIVKGQVIEINQVWSEQWSNISVTIADAEGNELYIYRMGTKVEAGDFVTVTGKMGTYNEARQVAQGATAVITGHEDLVVDENVKVLSFASADARTEFTTDKQVWSANGITLTNTKASSTSNIADYSAPARFYKSTDLKIECTGMTKIVFHLNSGKPASGLTDSLSGISGITVETDGYDVTIIFASATDSLYIASCAAQFRVDSIEVYTA